MGHKQTERWLVVTDGRTVGQLSETVSVDNSKRMIVFGELRGLGAGEGGGRGLFQVASGLKEAS
jgi:hypothetical protein